MKKKLLMIGVAGLVVAAFLIPSAPPAAEERGFKVTFVGFTNRTLGPHALLLLKTPEGVRRGNYSSAAWVLREVAYKEQTVWKSWISSTRVPQPHEFTLHEAGSNLLASVSVAQTNVPSRIVFELHVERRGLSEHVRKLWMRLTGRDSQRKGHDLNYRRTRVYYMTNEISVSSEIEAKDSA